MTDTIIILVFALPVLTAAVCLYIGFAVGRQFEHRHIESQCGEANLRYLIDTVNQTRQDEASRRLPPRDAFDFLVRQKRGAA